MSLNHSSRFAQLTEKHYTAIGQLVVEWANIDFVLRTVLARLLLAPDFPSRTFTDVIPAAKIQLAIHEAVELHRVRYGYGLVSCITHNFG